MARATGILYKVKHILDKKCLRNLYHVFIYPYLTYCNHVWGKASKKYINTLTTIQKKIVRLITFSKRNSHTDILYKSLNILRVADIHNYLIGVFMYKYIDNELPAIFNGMFIRNSQIHNYPTRSKDMFQLPKCHTSLRQKSILFNGALTWNTIAKNIHISNTLNTFKHTYKQFLVNSGGSQ